MDNLDTISVGGTVDMAIWMGRQNIAFSKNIGNTRHGGRAPGHVLGPGKCINFH